MEKNKKTDDDLKIENSKLIENLSYQKQLNFYLTKQIVQLRKKIEFLESKN